MNEWIDDAMASTGRLVMLAVAMFLAGAALGWAASGIYRLMGG